MAKIGDVQFIWGAYAFSMITPARRQQHSARQEWTSQQRIKPLTGECLRANEQKPRAVQRGAWIA
jgi:hypothetical protein